MESPGTEDMLDREPLITAIRDEQDARPYPTRLPWLQIAAMFTAYFAETICAVFAVRLPQLTTHL